MLHHTNDGLRSIAESARRLFTYRRFRRFLQVSGPIVVIFYYSWMFIRGCD